MKASELRTKSTEELNKELVDLLRAQFGLRMQISTQQSSKADLLRKTRKGRIFYGCANYPNCDFTSWKQPVNIPCPKCGGLMVVANKREYQCTNCQETFLMDQVGETAAESA